MKQNNKFVQGEKVLISSTGETVTINKISYIQHMKKFSYTISEKPATFYFEEEITKLV